MRGPQPQDLISHLYGVKVDAQVRQIPSQSLVGGMDDMLHSF